MIPFLRMWKVGFRFYGEQGAESIHAEFNNLNGTYGRMRVPTERLSQVVKWHNVAVHPEARGRRKDSVKRKFKKDCHTETGK